ncbi:hypothetical protein [Peribacillus sp. CSMR9]|uniref:hypothetical protein n=1 Tax=Peribacillus sp. CSMR9 TaxID=2981350 RepID=UPI0029548B64|nr:hypothetical protein [Peribacillus sp. CSMR9]MDV7763547.1 hypothetical protein [Peribacillus sp. CSMR9]
MSVSRILNYALYLYVLLYALIYFISSLDFLLLLYCVVILGVNEYESRFTTERWLNDDEGRVYLVDDLLNDHELIGKTKEEVITLLGSPAETEYFKEEDNVVYYLGAERGIISIDSEWLVIWFDGNEQAVKFELRTD